MQIIASHLSYTYDGTFDPALEDVSFAIDSDWRLGLIGRNGRGKTTLLRLLCGQLKGHGQLSVPLEPVYFPFDVPQGDLTAAEACLAAAPGAQLWQLEREMRLLRMDEAVLEHPFQTLSPGEQTKVHLAALFARDDVWPLIDEPTNHLDMPSRAQVADYLRRKDGFLLVSHDRAFLNRCIDHVLSINKADIWVMQGNYDTWQERYDNQQAYEAARDEALRKDVRRLDESAHRAASWASNTEKGKFHVSESEVAALDRGYVGARSAAMMKRAKSTVRRRNKALEEKRSLLQNAEQAGKLKLTNLTHPKEVLLSINNGRIRYGDRVVADGLSLTLRQGERVALTGPNGCGKSSLIKAICGEGCALEGDVRLATGLVISSIPQDMACVRGSMRAFMEERQVDETLFKAILRLCGFSREEFEHPLDGLSQGQRKKLLLAASLCKPAHLYIWDEPLNYLDVISRVQLEELILNSRPTLLYVEHDAAFVQHTSTRVFRMT